MLAGAFTFGELAARRPETGGPYVYLREAWGERTAFLYGWQCLLVMDPGITAALALGLSQYLVVLWPSAQGRERWLALAAIWTLALVTMTGLKASSRTLNLLTAVKVMALAGIVIGALAVGAGNWAHFTPFFARRAGAPPLSEALGLGLIGAFYSFGGFWEASRVAGEMGDPRRELPRALSLGVATVTAAYVVTSLAFVYLVAPEKATSAAAFGKLAGEALLGRAGAPVLALVVVVSVSASALALLLMAPRLYLAMGADGFFPASLSALHPRTGAPARATAFLSAVASVFVLTGSFSQVVVLFMVPTLGFIGLAACGLFVVRRRDPAAPAFRAPGYPATTALFVALLALVVVLMAVARPAQALAGCLIVLAGLPVHRALAGRGTRAGAKGGAA